VGWRPKLKSHGDLPRGTLRRTMTGSDKQYDYLKPYFDNVRATGLYDYAAPAGSREVAFS